MFAELERSVGQEFPPMSSRWSVLAAFRGFAPLTVMDSRLCPRVRGPRIATFRHIRTISDEDPMKPPIAPNSASKARPMKGMIAEDSREIAYAMPMAELRTWVGN